MPRLRSGAFNGELKKKKTPEKIIENNCCFICASRLQKNERILILGKSSFDFPSIVNNCLDINVRSYSETNDLSICKQHCYKSLLKFEKTFQLVHELKKQLKQTYENEKTLLRSKRLLSEREQRRGFDFIFTCCEIENSW